MAPGTRLPPQLLKYWSNGGEGGAKIDWGRSGDFSRCVRLVEEAIGKGGNAPLSPPIIHGLCATLHRLNTGASPGHAASEQVGH